MPEKQISRSKKQVLKPKKIDGSSLKALKIVIADLVKEIKISKS